MSATPLAGSGPPHPGPSPVGDAPSPVEQHVVRSTRTSRTSRTSRTGRAWTALILFVGVLILLLVFVLQNGESVKVSFLGADGTMPHAVAMLFAAAGGALLVAIPGMGRAVQPRRLAHRHRTAESYPADTLTGDGSGWRPPAACRTRPPRPAPHV